MVLTRTVKSIDFNEDSNNNNKKLCYFCGGNHLCRQCPQEAILAPILKKYIGSIMENFISDNHYCPICKSKKMKVLGNHSPSLDIICKNCDRKFEVKSKCLSVNRLPLDLQLPHGNYKDYKERQDSGLDFFIIIYKVDRINKKIRIREVLYIKNKNIKEDYNFRVIKRRDSNLSNIFIKDRTKFEKLKLDNNIEFDFSNIVNEYTQGIKKLEKKIIENSSESNYII